MTEPNISVAGRISLIPWRGRRAHLPVARSRELLSNRTQDTPQRASLLYCTRAPVAIRIRPTQEPVGRGEGKGESETPPQRPMATTTHLLLLVWALVAADLFGTGLARASVAALGKEQREFDYFALALQWPGTICASTRKCCAINGCCREEPLQTFTIHGLWPDYDDGTWPSCCRHTSFDMDKISSLKPMLDQYWPSLYCSTSSTCFSGKGPFWAHEWEKHGTCSSPVVEDELQYFTKALDLYFKHNVTEMLATGDILVANGEKYALTDVINTITHAFGGSPQIICKKGSVQELRLCFTKELKPRDCLTTSGVHKTLLKSSCPRYISLPAYDPIALTNSTVEILTEASNDEMYFFTS